ncbi:MAG: asparagine synthase (glutamine-hydrolyzing) [Candidatus Acidiferrales bacterium]
MCGICGIYNLNSRVPIDRTALEAMNARIAHRGPDDEGFYVSGNLGIAMRRLSIVDLQTGQQPVTNEDETIWLVYHGEIYNQAELRAQLITQGHHFRSRSDTETIVHLYEQYGAGCVNHLRGMFAFALWDSRRRRLFVARDRLGIKPLYYRLTRDSFLFASEIKAILAHPSVRAEFNLHALPEYLAFGYLAGPQTLFEGIRKLSPGHTLEIDATGNLSLREYWDLPHNVTVASQSEKECVHTYREMLEGAVQSHLMSDVPLGMFLSGGLDSSAIAALMTKLRREPIETFSVGYEEEAFSELSYARVVSKHIGSNHHEVRVNFQHFVDALPKLIWHEDEPLVWPSSVSLYFVSQLAREHVKVVLTGEGSDETLAGYTRYAWTLWNTKLDRVYRQLTPEAQRHLVRTLIAHSSLASSGLRRKLQHSFLGRDGASWESFYFDNFYSAFSASAQEELLSDSAARVGGPIYEDSLAFWKKSSGDMLPRLLYTDIKTYLVELLMKQDNMSMAASLESRVPFLDHPLVEYAVRIPPRFNIQRLSGKWILKSAVKDLLPDEIVYRKKMGFPTPWRGWLEGAHLTDVAKLLTEPRSVSRRLFKAQAVERLFTEHRARLHDHGDRIWRLLNLELWLRIFIDGDSTASVSCSEAAAAHQ